jgi:DNA processing protein
MRVEPDLADWIRLSLTAGVGDETARELLSHFGLPQNIFASSHTALVSAVGHKFASALLAEPDTELIKRTLDWAGADNHHILTLGDADYPRALLTISDPPPLLYLIGRTDLMNQPALAMVGSRSASPQGLANAEQFARTFSDAGLCIVSGMALGIDAAAHRGALAGATSTIAVIGTGADIVYPSRNRDLAHAIADRGAILSCYSLGTPAIGNNFPRRNRLISGLSRGVLVVEAALQSGSLITARFAGEQGREVFAIPGSIHSPHAKGCHRLIKQGAKLVESATDVLEELGNVGDVSAIAGASLRGRFTNSPVKAAKSKSAPSAELANDPDMQTLLQHLGSGISDIDSLCELSGLTSGRVSAMLLQLELEGSVASLPGGRYQRVS